MRLLASGTRSKRRLKASVQALTEGVQESSSSWRSWSELALKPKVKPPPT